MEDDEFTLPTAWTNGEMECKLCKRLVIVYMMDYYGYVYCIRCMRRALALIARPLKLRALPLDRSKRTE